MGRQPGGIYRNRQDKLRYKYTFPNGAPRVWDEFVPTPDDGSPLDEAWADLFLAAFRRKVKGGWDPRKETSPESGVLTVGEYVMKWIKGQTYEDASRDVLRMERHLLPSMLAQMPIKDVRPRHCLGYVRWLIARPSEQGGTLAARSVRTMAACVQRAFSQAVRDELIAVSPWNLPPNTLPAIEDKVLGARDTWLFTVEEVLALCYSPKIDADRRAMWLVLFLCGCRAGELVAIRVKDWHHTKEPLGALSINKARSALHKTIKSTKSKAPRLVPVHPTLAEGLSLWTEGGLANQLGREATGDDLLFPSPRTGKERCGNSIRKALNADLKTLGYRPRRAHDTRRTHISLLVDAGADREIVKVWTHGKRKDVFSGYTTESWSTFCREMLKLKFTKPEASAISNAIEVKGVIGKMLNLQKEGFEAGDEIRTHDLHLGKVTLYR
jgi:integrase